MNKESFIRYIENTRDCDETMLDLAVGRGLRKAENSRLDPRKFLMAAAVCVCTAAACFTVNLRVFKSAVEDYYRNQSVTMPGSGEALEAYFNSMAGNARRYLDLGGR